MNEIDRLKQLDAATGPPPRVDVAARVVADIRRIPGRFARRCWWCWRPWGPRPP